MGVLRFIGGMLQTLLPPRYREGQKLSAHAVTCGILQSILCVFIGVAWMNMRAWRGDDFGLSAEAVKEIWQGSNPGAVYGSGMVAGFANFWLNPVTLVLYYFLFEGAVRMGAAIGPKQVIGTLPLYAVSGVHGLIERLLHRRTLGPLVVDEIARGGEKQKYDLKIYSCRPKLDWNPYITIEFEGQFYQMYDEEPTDGPRRFVYYLRKNPTGRIVSKVLPYRRDDVLKPPPDKWKGTPGVRDVLIAKRKAAPSAPDEIVRGGERQGYDLKIYSCSEKRDWNHYVAIEFEGQLYQMFKEDHGPETHPFVYYLRKNPVGHPASVVRKYDPPARTAR